MSDSNLLKTICVACDSAKLNHASTGNQRCQEMPKRGTTHATVKDQEKAHNLPFQACLLKVPAFFIHHEVLCHRPSGHPWSCVCRKTPALGKKTPRFRKHEPRFLMLTALNLSFVSTRSMSAMVISMASTHLILLYRGRTLSVLVTSISLMELRPRLVLLPTWLRFLVRFGARPALTCLAGVSTPVPISMPKS